MNRYLILLTGGFWLIPSLSPGAQTAQARLVCLSLHVQRGTANDMNGFRWTMDMTTLPAGNNGELAPSFFSSPTGYSNSTYLDLYSELFEENFAGAMVVNNPEMADANHNGFADFFELSQAVPSLPASGIYDINGFGGGSFTATWYRDAGSPIGALTYTIPNPFGGNLAFYHQFELIEYDGALSYTPGSNVVSGSVSLTHTNSGTTLDGRVEFNKSATNRFNQLTLASALLTNLFQQTFDLYTPTTFLRRISHLTNYYGNVEFNDGDPNTVEDDYYTWLLSIDDPNDSDGDGIPDFSDDLAGATPPRRPQLALARGPTNLLLTIKGDVGRLHQIQETTNAASPTWQTVLSVTLTNDPQTVSIPLPATMTRFWRARAQ